jgi:sarcosine oxidase
VRIVVVGAGLLGLSTARELSQRGHDVVCLEQSAAGHERSGSKGASRLFRLSHDDPHLVRLARRSLTGWEELQAEAGEELLAPTALLMFGGRMSRYESAMAAAGARVRLPTRAELAERFSGFAFTGPDSFQGEVLLEDTARIMFADRVLRALARLSRAELREHERVARITEAEDHVVVSTFTSSYRCDCVVICAGAWSGDMARIAGVPGASSLQPSTGQVAYLKPRSGPLGDAPAFMELGAGGAHRAGGASGASGGTSGLPSYAWGVPTPTENTYKVGLHRPRERVDPSLVSLDPDPAELEELASHAARLLPGFDPCPVATERCFFDSSPDEELVIDRAGRVVIGAGTSGRGFKFGTVIGEMLADLAESKIPELWDQRFSLRRLERAADPLPFVDGLFDSSR